MGQDNFIHKKQYGTFRGLDLSKDALQLGQDYASEALNTIHRPGTNAVTARAGFRSSQTLSKKLFGNYPYTRVDPSTGAISEDIVSLSYNSFSAAYVTERVTLACGNGGTDCRFAFVLDPATNKSLFTIKSPDGLTTYLSLFTDSAPGVPSKTLGELVSAINAVSPFSAVVYADNRSIDPTSEMVSPVLDYVEGAVDFLYGEMAMLIRPGGTNTIFPSWQSGVASAELPAFCNLNGVLYLASGADNTMKYDGRRIYAAGLPPGGINPLPIGAAAGGNLADGYYTYAMEYEMVDFQGNVYQGLGGAQPSDVGDVNYPGPKQQQTAGSNHSINVQINNIQDTSPFMANGANINGNQTLSLTVPVITVTASHTLFPGDTACFRAKIDHYTSGPTHFEGWCLVEALISSVTATTISLNTATPVTITYVDPANTYSFLNPTTSLPRFASEVISDFWTLAPGFVSIKVVDADAISNNLRINLYRVKGAGLTSDALSSYDNIWYLLDIVPNHPTTHHTTYADVIADENLGGAWVQKLPIGPEPYTSSALNSVPMGQYISAHGNRLYIAKNNILSRSDPLFGPEYFDPAGSAQLDMSAYRGLNITGIAGIGDRFIVGKDSSILHVYGDLGTNANVRVAPLTQDLGCLAHASISQFTSGLSMLSTRGPIAIGADASISFIGADETGGRSRLERAILDPTADTKRSGSCVDRKNGLLYLHIPTTSNTALGLHGIVGANTVAENQPIGITYVYDLLRDAWHRWVGPDMSGGGAIKDNRLYFTRLFFSNTVGVSTLPLKALNTSTIADYIDWISSYDWEYSTHYEDLGEPLQRKRFNKIQIYAIEPTPLANNAPTITGITDVEWTPNSAGSSFSLTQGAQLRFPKKLLTTNVLSLRLRLTSTVLYSRPLVSGLDLEAVASFRPKITPQ